ncbi:hypothetical protein [Stenotrophomonas lactitubi]|jgi:hypothetical protein|nr:hypothetical protein [Stenotrophomonas lactitubi]
MAWIYFMPSLITRPSLFPAVPASALLGGTDEAELFLDAMQ